MKAGFITVLLGLSAAFSAAGTRPSPSPETRHVVLVHGFLETGNAFNFMKRKLEKQGFICHIPKLRPSDGRGGLERLAQGLKNDINQTLGPDQDFSIIAFSMGGLVSRHYLQELGGAPRCRHLFTISSPHHGTRAAWLYPTLGASQMRPGSEFLATLDRSEHRLGSMPVVSYRTPLDLIILPATSSVWDRAENIEHPALLHPLMVTSGTVIRDISRRLSAPSAD